MEWCTSPLFTLQAGSSETDAVGNSTCELVAWKQMCLEEVLILQQ